MKKALIIFTVLAVIISCKDKDLKPSATSSSQLNTSNISTEIQQTLEDLEIDENTTTEQFQEIIENESFVWPEQLETGIKTTLRGNGNTVILTYDHTNEDIEIRAQGTTTFLNDEGFVIVFNPKKQRWQKVQVGGFMESKIMKDFANSFGYLPTNISKNLDSISKSESAIHNIVNWVKRMTPKKLAKNPDFDKDIKHCQDNSRDICIVFTGVEGKSKGVTIFFDIDFRLQHIAFGSHGTVSYEYGKYNVEAPPAELLTF